VVLPPAFLRGSHGTRRFLSNAVWDEDKGVVSLIEIPGIARNQSKPLVDGQCSLKGIGQFPAVHAAQFRGVIGVLFGESQACEATLWRVRSP
jgi:hypothetical protein